MRFRVQRVWKIQFGRVLWGFRNSGKFKSEIAFFEAFLWGGVFPGPPAWGLEWCLQLRLRLEVHRGLGKSNLAGYSGVSEKVNNSSLKQ